MDSSTPVFAAINTLRASSWTLLLAKLFGKRHVMEDAGLIVTIHEWRGKRYLTNCEEI